MNNKFKIKHWFGYLLIFILIIITGIVWKKVTNTYSITEKTLDVTFLDVNQGDSIFIETPLGQNILIDGGACIKDWSNFDAGKDVLLPYFKKHNINSLDLVIATHPHLDHIGGLLEVLKNIKVKKIIDSDTISTTYTYEKFLKLIESENIEYQIAKPGIIHIGPYVTLQILSQIDNRFQNIPNDNSILIKLSCGHINFLFAGDITQPAEDFYVSHYGNQLNSTVLKIPHHGGKTSATNNFLKAVQPDIAIISCGNNPFGHPSKEVLDRIKQHHIKLYRTDRDGNITIETDGSKVKILCDR